MSADETGIWRRDLCKCGRTISRNTLKSEQVEPWRHWDAVGGVACRPEEGDRSPVATPRRTAAGDVRVAGAPKGGGDSR